MNVSGIIKTIGETKQITDKFKKRELILTTKDQYPQTLCIEFIKDQCDLLDKYADGAEVKVDINLKGREWTSPDGEVKYFNSIQGWRIFPVSQMQEPIDNMVKAMMPEDAQRERDQAIENEENESGLPF